MNISIQSTRILNYKTIVLLFLLNSTFIVSQNKYEDALKNFYQKNQATFNLQPEQYLIHTNKDIYFFDETIWMKIYVLNTDTNKLIKEPANIHVSLFNSKGDLVTSLMMLSQKGLAQGSFEITDMKEQGLFYLKVNTYKNQQESNQSFVKEIQILDNKNPEFKSTKTELADVNEISIYPNNGKFIINAYNQITIETSSKKKGLTGYIIDDKSKVQLSKFTTDSNGIANANLFIKNKHSYTVILNDESNTYTTPLLDTFEVTKGFNVVDRSEKDDDVLKFELFVSPEVKLSKNLYYSVLEHGDEVLEINAFKLKHTRSKLLYAENKVNKGVYTISIFSPKNELLTKQYFKRNILLSDSFLEVSNISKATDSVSFNLNLPHEGNAQISMSIVPQESKLFLKTSSTFKNQYLLNTLGVIPSYGQNFNGLDLDWQLNSFRTKNATNYNVQHEVGINISGRVLTKMKDLKGHNVMMLLKDENYAEMQEITNAFFEFSNNYINNLSQVVFSLNNEKREPVEAKFKLNETYIKFQEDSLNISFIKNHIRKKNNDLDSVNELTYIKDINHLDEVKLAPISNKKLTPKEAFLEEIANTNPFGRVFEVRESEEYLPLELILQRIPGLNVFRGSDGILQLSFRRNQFRSFNPEQTPVLIYIDNFRYFDTSILTGMNGGELVAIETDPTGFGEGFQGSSGVIRFHTKMGTGLGFLENDSNLVGTFQIPTGFANNQDKRYDNIYKFKSETAKKYFNAIDWYPNVSIIDGQSQQLKFSPDGLTKFKCIVNGVTDNGTIISEEIIIDLEKDLKILN